jgi:phospholipase C
MPPKKAARAPRTTFVQTAADPTEANLQKINHIVVLLMENRSFDHMLGYLKLEGGVAVDGLDAGMSNTHEGATYKVHHLRSTKLRKAQDPDHSGKGVAEQLANANGGFVSNFARTRVGETPGVVMGYHNGADLPVYDHLAREYAVCDRWFCSVPGATWPNRLYAVAGRAAGSKDNRQNPIYDLPSFPRQLDAAKKSWFWYAHEHVGTLRLTDSRYRLGHFNRFRYFDRRTLGVGKSFIEHAAAGELAAVSWIDPNFVDFDLLGPAGSNDDHPPSDLRAGQDLVLKLYNAVAGGPQWKKTLIVITYDEHGGFFDHVPPPAAPDDRPAFRSYGPRVPAIVISPWIKRGTVSSTVFDHASIIKTILLRFCKRADGRIPDLGARVNGANHLGGLLTLGQARAAPPKAALRPLIDATASWRASVVRENMEALAEGIAPEPPELNELQQGFLKAKAQLRAEGLPEGQP